VLNKNTTGTTQRKKQSGQQFVTRRQAILNFLKRFEKKQALLLIKGG
jgi:hypothetical protein